MKNFRWDVFAATVIAGLLSWGVVSAQQGQNIVYEPAPYTGTGNWVRATSPTLATPTLGVAAATSTAVGGCTIGSNSVCTGGSILAGGNITFSTDAAFDLGVGGARVRNINGTGSITLGSTSPVVFGSRATITSPADGVIQPQTSAITGAQLTVSTLPSCTSGLKGSRAFVTDANATTFLSTVAAGGANNVPVVCDGTNWKIG